MSANIPNPPYLRDCGELNPDGFLLECVIPGDGKRATRVIGLGLEQCRRVLTDIARQLEHACDPVEAILHPDPGWSMVLALSVAHAELWAFRLAAAILIRGQRMRHAAAAAARGQSALAGAGS